MQKLNDFAPRYIIYTNARQTTHHAKTDLNKKYGAIHQTLIKFNIDAQGFRKTKSENPPTQEIGVTS